MTTEGKSDQSRGPDFGDLAEEMEDAMAQARKSVDDLPPLKELGGMQEALVGLARMGSVVEKMRRAAEQHEQAVAELVGEPDWRVEAEIEVKKDTSLLMKVELAADFDLEIIMHAHDIASTGETQTRIAGVLKGMGLDVGSVHEQVARGRGMALIRELNLVEPRVDAPPPKAPQEPRLTPEANIPLELSDERELCFDFGPALTLIGPRAIPELEPAEVRSFGPTTADVRMALSSFEPGQPFERTLTVSQGELELELKLAFRPL